MTNVDKASILPESSLKTASMYETQSESELVALSESLPISEIEKPSASVAIEKEKSPGKKESPPSAKMSNRSKRREKRLRNEPPNVTGR